MTPEEARDLLARILTLKAPGFKEPEAFDAISTIASMRTEYSLIHQPYPGAEWHQITHWSGSKNPLNKGYELADNERIVMRYSTEPQPLGEEQ